MFAYKYRIQFKLLMMIVSPYKFIVSPIGDKYNNKKEIGNGKSYYLSSSIENAIDVNRFAVVVQVPLNYKGKVEVGDEVVIHHNIFRDYYDYHGKIKHSSHYLYDNLYLIDDSEIYLFRSADKSKVWESNLDYVLVEPVWSEKFSMKSKKDKVGWVVITSNEDLQHSIIGFTPESEYEIQMKNEEGEDIVYYRMRERDICVRY